MTAREQILALSDEEAKKIFANEHCNISADLAGILARAIIESYKAELLKEVGEPVGQGLFDAEGKCHAIGQHKSSGYIGGKSFKSQPLYTESQLLAARKPLEEEIEQLRSQNNDFTELDKQLEAEVGMDLTSMPNAINELRTQLAAAHEPQWQPISAAPEGGRFLTATKLSDGSYGQVGISHKFYCYAVNSRGWQLAGDDPHATHWMPLPAAPKGKVK